MRIAGRSTRTITSVLLTAAFLTAGCEQPSEATASFREARAPASADDSQRATSAASTTTPGSPFATDDTAYLTRLGLIRGHLRVGMELYREGKHEHAKRHMKHPADELYAALGDAFDHRGSAGFAGPLETLATLVTSDAADTDVERAYAALLTGIAAAEAQVDPAVTQQPAQQIDVVVKLLETAADEYGEGVVDGRIEAVHEYQDAYGFTRIALERATSAREAAGSDADRSRLNEVVSEIQDLSVLWPELVPVDSIDGSAARIETVAKNSAGRKNPEP